MKRTKIASLLLAAVLLMAVGLSGCTGGCSTGTPSSSSTSSSMSSSSSSSLPPSSSSSSSTSASEPSTSTSGGTSSSSTGSTSAAATMGTDFGEIGALPSKSLDWGPGGPVDGKNRSQGAIAYNQKYGKYGAMFLGPEDNNVYMTFDEGYEFGLTPQFLDILKEKGVKGLFFVTRDFVKAEPALVQRMLDEGHVVGNHSWSHKNYSTLTPKEAAEDMMKLHDLVKEQFSYEMKYFRFPSGNFNEQTLAVVQSMGYRSVFWSFAYKDWLTDAQPEPAASADKIVKAACPGNIYLLHAVSTTNASVLGQVIDRIREKGYTWADPSLL